MSLINQMLQDLEKRQGETESGGQLPLGVHSSAQPAVSGKGRLLLLAGVLLALLAGGAYWYKNRPADNLPLASVEIPPPPALVVPETVPPPVAPPTGSDAAASPVAAAPAVDTSTPKRAPDAKKESRKEAKKRMAEEARAASLAARQKAPLAVSGQAVAVKPSLLDEAQERAEAYYRDALSAFSQGRTTETQQSARKALLEMPGHIGARQLLVRQLMEQRANDQARAELNAGLKHQPAQMLWSTLLVRLELERGDTAAARQAVDRALPYAEQQADFQSLAGAVAQRQGKPGDAADFYRNALRLKPGDGRSWVGLAMSLEAEGHAPEAREAFRRALTTDSLSGELQALAERKSR